MNINRYHIFIILLFFGSLVMAQENNFDEDFLNSLPDEVRSDLEKEIESDNEDIKLYKGKR